MLQLNAIRIRWRLPIACCALLTCLVPRSGRSQSSIDCPPIERVLPPVGVALPEARVNEWQARLQQLQTRLAELRGDGSQVVQADVGVLIKACRYAIDHRELYKASDFGKVDRLLNMAQQRIQDLQAGHSAWTTAGGLQVRGFQSRVDGSYQPVGLVLPDDWAAGDRPLPLYVWLHGRGDKTTDLHFICERLDKPGQIAPPGAIVLHPFGRHCVGYKSAGETDVMEAIEFVCNQYPVDRQRIVLMGFSMGGAGVWHLAAHYGERFVAASPGAGFAETARYQGLKPERYPPAYEQMLWSIYDVPGYTRNLFNLEFVAYSGELDKQIQAAQVMEEAFAAEGRTLPHLIGPGMGHKYHPDTLAEILERMDEAVQRGLPTAPEQFHIQTRHLRYASRGWLQVDGMLQGYQDTRVDAARQNSDWRLATQNVSRLQLRTDMADAPRSKVFIDGAQVGLPAGPQALLVREAGGWKLVDRFATLRKRPGLSGPIDDAFIDPFLVVVPGENTLSRPVDRWVACELDNFQRRWRELFRGDVRIKRDDQVTAADMAQYHLIAWGTPDSNSVIGNIFQAGQQQAWPLIWRDAEVGVGAATASSDSHALLAIYPNPLASDRYIVLNSGPTFRQAHDRTNSLQNPHLPDWALLSLDTPPSNQLPGRIVRTGFFDEDWAVDPQRTW